MLRGFRRERLNHAPPEDGIPKYEHKTSDLEVVQDVLFFD